MALLIYEAPDGATFQYEEGTQPEGYKLAAVQAAGCEPPKPARKRRTAANKAQQPKNK